jgi:hypothetical protein
MLAWIILVGMLGICGTGLGIVYCNRYRPQWQPQWFWFLGLAALFPAWLCTFLSLFGSPSGSADVEVAMPPAALVSSGAALLGVVGTDAAVRRLLASERGLRPVIAWLLGVVSFVPAWGIALSGLLRR